MSKTEAIRFTRSKRHLARRLDVKMRVRGRDITFAKEATRWLGVWLDPALKMNVNRRKCINRAKAAAARLQGLVGRNGIPPSSARNLQLAIIQSTMMYVSELTWTGKGPMENEYQLAINQMARQTLGCLPSTPLGALMRESNLTPAAALLNHRQAQYTHRLLARPPGHGGPEEILGKHGTPLANRLLQSTGLEKEEEHEKMAMPMASKTKATIVIESKEEAAAIAKGWQDKLNTVWTDGSRLEDGRVGAAVAWEKAAPGEGEREEWTGMNWHLGSNKEVFDDAILRALYRFDGGDKATRTTPSLPTRSRP